VITLSKAYPIDPLSHEVLVFFQTALVLLADTSGPIDEVASFANAA